jgi:thiamine pyrophosphate-dependent acetolactate synthase large subunit-like protein
MMNVLDACKAINDKRGDAVVVSTMASLIAFDKLDQQQPRLSSVPLMGGAACLGLGIALGTPGRKVIVVDGDSSLLLQLGSLATVSGQKPTNFYHFVVNNRTQFAGFANVKVPGAGAVDFAAMALAAGYMSAIKINDLATLQSKMSGILESTGPVFVELAIEPDVPSLSGQTPQKEWSQVRFTRMGDEARALRELLGTRPAGSAW